MKKIDVLEHCDNYCLLISRMTKKILSAGILLMIASTSLSQTRYDTFISVTHNDSVDAVYYYPAESPPQEGYPAILTVHGFGSTKESRIPFCSTYAANGFVTIAYTVRGHGQSSGLSTIMSVDERSDLQYVFQYLKSLPNIDTNNIGIIGGSQGGLHGLWAAADQIPLKAIVADVIVPRWASDMLANGCIRRTLLNLLRTNSVRYYQGRDDLWELVRTDSYDSLLSKFPRARDVETSSLLQSAIPMMTLLKWQDHYFTAANGIEFLRNQTATKKVYLGTVGHWSDESESERWFQSDLIFRWFRNFLKQDSTGILDEPEYTYAYSSLHMDTMGYYNWAHVGEQTWPPAGVEFRKFYLSRDSMLLFSPSIHSDSFTLSNNYLNPAYTCDTAYIEGFKGSRFDILLPKQTIAFTSPVLWDEIFWVGAPKMKVFVKSNYENFPLHAQIYEIDNTGRKYFINRINFTARHWIPGTSGWIEIEGTEHAHQFSRGSRIRVEITNIDKTNRQLLGEFPFVVPMFAQASATIIADATHPSYIELPMIGDPTKVALRTYGLAKAYELYQNYPNPFNPVTIIRYDIPSQSKVTLKIYNILGQEVVTLVDDVQEAGRKIVSWNASQLASGVYFCRLYAGEFSGVKKMLLIK